MRSRWDMTPAVGATPMVGGGVTPGFYTGATPAGMSGMETPSTAARMGQVPATPEQYYVSKDVFLSAVSFVHQRTEWA